jgi:hypothetical protein
MDCVHRWRWVGISLLVALVAGCGWPDVIGSGQVVTEERQLYDFVALEVSDGIDATVVVDTTQPAQLRVVGDDNLVARVQTELVGADTLSVHFLREDTGGWSSSNPLRVEMTVPLLDSLSRSGGGTVDLTGNVSPSFFLLSASGGGIVKARGLSSQTLRVETSGGANVTLEGQATQVTSSSSGGGVLNARELSVQEASLSSSGGNHAVMRVSDTLRVSASGGAEVHIIGQPQVLSRELSGGSSLKFE